MARDWIFINACDGVPLDHSEYWPIARENMTPAEIRRAVAQVARRNPTLLVGAIPVPNCDESLVMQWNEAKGVFVDRDGTPLDKQPTAVDSPLRDALATYTRDLSEPEGLSFEQGLKILEAEYRGRAVIADDDADRPYAVTPAVVKARFAAWGHDVNVELCDGQIWVEPITRTLWCVHVQGPDSIIAQPDHATAVQRAAEWNQTLAAIMRSNPSPYAPKMLAVVARYPGTPESHAAELAEHGGQPEDIC